MHRLTMIGHDWFSATRAWYFLVSSQRVNAVYDGQYARRSGPHDCHCEYGLPLKLPSYGPQMISDICRAFSSRGRAYITGRYRKFAECEKCMSVDIMI